MILQNIFLYQFCEFKYKVKINMNDEQIPFFNSKFYKNNYNEKEDIFNHFLSEKPIDNKYCCFHCLRKIPLFCCFFGFILYCYLFY